jgi:hypothetical protein
MPPAAASQISTLRSRVGEMVSSCLSLIDRVNFTPPPGFLQGKKGLFLGFIWVFELV